MKTKKGGQHRLETTDYFVKSLTTYYGDSFSCHYFGEENVHEVQVFIRILVCNDYGYAGFDYLIDVKYTVLSK